MINLRTATEDDAAAISALMSSFAAGLVTDSAGQGTRPFLDSVSTETLRGYLASDRCSFTVAHDNGRIVGVIALVARTHLSYFFVDRAWQRRGIGRRLWDHARMQAVFGGHSGSFHVFAAMSAIPAYSRLGFSAIGVPCNVLGVQCVPMAFGDTSRIRSFSMVLPSEEMAPALNRAAEEFLQAMGPVPAAGSEDLIHARVAAAACLAGAVLLREADGATAQDPGIRARLFDFRHRQSSLQIFMDLRCRRIDPQIDASLAPGAERAEDLMNGGWFDAVPAEHAALFDVDALIGKFGNLPEQVADQHGIPLALRAHVVALAAMKLIATAHREGLLDERAGRALVRIYMAAGCKAPPVELPHPLSRA